MKSEIFKITPLALGIGVVLCTGAAQVFAESFALEEIVITAQKREESLMDVPVSVSAIGGEKIKSAGIQNFEHMSAYVPNFTVQKDPIGDKINIRGIQSGNNAGLEQSVATFVDGLYRGRGTQSRFAFLDVSMVEVLRGPQGTLFGKNTIGGALNIRSAKPTEEFEAQLSAQYNVDFDETELQGAVSGSLTDGLRARLAIMDRQMDEGWVRNEFDGEDVGQTDETAGRISLEWDASENMLVSLKYEYGKWDNLGQPWELITVGALAGFGEQGNTDYSTNMTNSPDWLESLLGPGSAGDTSAIDFGNNALFEGDLGEFGLTVEHYMDSGSTVTMILGHSEYRFDRFLDADFNPAPVARFDDGEEFDQKSFELRLASDLGGDY